MRRPLAVRAGAAAWLAVSVLLSLPAAPARADDCPALERPASGTFCAYDIEPIAGQAFTGAVAKATTADLAPESDLPAMTVDWGDESEPVDLPAQNDVAVAGSHTYEDAGGATTTGSSGWGNGDFSATMD